MRARLPLGTAVLAAAMVLYGPGGTVNAAPPAARLVEAPAGQAVKDSYIVVLDRGAIGATGAAGVAAKARSLAGAHGGVLGYTYSASLRGFSVHMNEEQARKLAADPAVAYVAQDAVVRATTIQPNPPSYGLDRIDQRMGPADFKYTYDTTGAGVTAYVVDSGIRPSHTTFQGRARHGFDFVDNDAFAGDCFGHGTHVAGTIGGAEYGVAKAVQLVAVRVLDCVGEGLTSGILAGIDWVTRNAVRPAVVNMSIGSVFGPVPVVDDAVNASIATGLTWVLAAGNSGTDACSVSPARVSTAITVSAVDQVNSRPAFANIGPCVDIFAPGVDITSAGIASDTATRVARGTSMAAPHVAGVAARYLQRHPSASPRQVHDAIVDAANPTILNPLSGTANRVLYANIGGLNPDAVGTVAVDGQRPYTFVRGADGNLWVNWWDGATWIWSNQGRPASGPVESGIGAVATQNGSMPFAFVRGVDGNLWAHWWNGSVWTWSDLGRPGGAKVDSGIGVVTVDGGNKPVTFVRGTDGNLWLNWFTGSATGWSNQGMPISAIPSFSGIDTGVGAVTVDGNRPYVFVQGNDDFLWVNWFDGASWRWTNHGRPGGLGSFSMFASGIGAVAVDGNKPHAFVRGTDGNMYVNWFNGSVWTWTNQGRPTSASVESPIATVLVAGNRPYVFVRGTDANLWVNWFSGSAWTWSNQGRPPQTTPESGLGAVTVGVDRTFVFLRGGDTNVWSHSWNGGAWIWGNHGTR